MKLIREVLRLEAIYFVGLMIWSLIIYETIYSSTITQLITKIIVLKYDRIIN